MVVDIGKILLEQIEDLPFIEKKAGVVRILSFKDDTGTIKKFPVDCQISLSECNKNKRYLDLCPDDKKKSVLFFEDNGLRLLKREGHLSYWKASLDLVCWLNLPRLGVSDSCSYSAVAILGIMKSLVWQSFNALNLYQYCTINVTGQQSKNINPFAKYSFDETVNQYLIYPYDYFTLMIEVDFRMDNRCFNIAELNPPLNCIKK